MGAGRRTNGDKRGKLEKPRTPLLESGTREKRPRFKIKLGEGGEERCRKRVLKGKERDQQQL